MTWLVLDFLFSLLARLPFVQTIYSATKRLLEILPQPPVSGQRAVLFAFTSSEMKALGFVTKVMTGPDTGRQQSAVYTCPPRPTLPPATSRWCP